MTDLLAGAVWECASSTAGQISDPEELAGSSLEWFPAQVPGTVAGALRALGVWAPGTDDRELLDGRDWWFRCRVDDTSSPGERWLLRADGVATVADIWINRVLVLHTENMFVGHSVEVNDLLATNEVVIRCLALEPLLAVARPRPRWKARLVRSQNLRWWRTSLIGRMPAWSAGGAPVGPWRPVTLCSTTSTFVPAQRHVAARIDGDAGIVDVEVTLRPSAPRPVTITLSVAGETAPGWAVEVAGQVVVRASLRLERVEQWWPHSHGGQRRYGVELTIDGLVCSLGQVGFRLVTAQTSDGQFSLAVNGRTIFCRGACWVPPDTVSFAASADEVRRSLVRLRDAGMNMVRVAGYLAYEEATFWDLCDELGILVWQDVMLAGVDPPEDPAWLGVLHAELLAVFGALGGRPSLAVVCGSSEIQQQAAMFGLPPAAWTSTALDSLIPATLDRLLPGVPYVPSSPTGGDVPFDPGTGVAHYFGVGAYLRPPSDVRRAGVRFAAECLAFATPPEPPLVEAAFGGAERAGHDPRWKDGVARDHGASWDFEDVRNHYVRTVFGVDPLEVRYSDPDRALDLGRAVSVELMSGAMAEWRRPASPCAGALVLAWRDLRPGAGWGLLDSSGAPKAPWFALRRVLAPVAVVCLDEGLSGLRLHVYNDGPVSFHGRLHLEVYNHGGTVVESAQTSVDVSGHGTIELSAVALLGGFRDLTRAYRFGPPAHDVVVATLYRDQALISRDFYLPEGPGRPLDTDIGLRARAYPTPDGWEMEVGTQRFAHYVAIDVPGFEPGDSWFHLPPGGGLIMTLTATDGEAGGGPGETRPRGRVRALNSRTSVPVVVDR